MDLQGWVPVTEVKKLNVKPGKEVAFDTANLQVASNWTAYKRIVDGEVVLVYEYPNDQRCALTDAQLERVLQLAKSFDRKVTMELVCELGNRSDEARITPFLSDKYVFHWAESHSQKIRGEMPKTFQEYLSIVNRVDKPSVAQSIYSPGTNQQFNSAAAIVADPTPLPAPESAPSPPRAAPRKRAPKKPKIAKEEEEDEEEREEVKPPKKRKQPAPKEVEPEEEEPPKKASPKAVKNSAPKRQKVSKANSAATQVILQLRERLVNQLDKTPSDKLANLQKRWPASEIDSVVRTLQTELDVVTSLFVLVYFTSMDDKKEFDTYTLPTAVDKLTTDDLKVVSHYSKAQKVEYKTLKEFVDKGLIYLTSHNAHLINIYHSSVISLIEQLSHSEAEERKKRFDQLLKSLPDGTHVYARLVVYFNSFRQPTPSVEEDEDGLDFEQS